MSPFFDFEAHLERVSPLGWRIYKETQRANIGFMASSVAYQAFVALIPLLVVVFLLVAVFAGQTLAIEALTLAAAFLPEEARRLLEESITGRIEASTTSVISVGILLWAALGLFKGLDTAFSVIYQTPSENSVTDQLTDALVAFLVLLVAIVGAVVAASLSFLVRIPFIGVASSLFLILGLTGVFFPIYYLFPDTLVSPRHALPGAAIAAIGWTALQALFQLYVAFAADPTVSGAVGGVLILLTWLYFGNFILLFGATVNRALADPEPIDNRQAT